MRIYEIVDAEAQLDLLRTIMDNTWTAIAQQAEEQKRSEAERQAWSKHAEPVKGTKTKAKVKTINPAKQASRAAGKQPLAVRAQTSSRLGAAAKTLSMTTTPPTQAAAQTTAANTALKIKPAGTEAMPSTAATPPSLATASEVKPSVKLEPELKAKYRGVKWIPKKA